MAGEIYPPENEVPELPNEFGEPRKEALTLGARLLFIIVAVVGVGSLAWGVWHFKTSIKTPFLAKGGNTAAAENDINKLISLQSQDTDEDGLSDYDETYVYKTSIYLKDTDSDGFDDKKEIDNGYDPNCPAGQNCGLPESSAEPGAAASTGNDIADQLLSGSMTPDQVRALLLESGSMSQADLDKIDDQTLMEVFQEAVAGGLADSETTIDTNTDQTATNSTPTDEEVSDYLKNLSVEEIRKLLVEQGMDQAEVDGIDDQTLIQLWQEILAEKEAQ